MAENREGPQALPTPKALSAHRHRHRAPTTPTQHTALSPRLQPHRQSAATTSRSSQQGGISGTGFPRQIFVIDAWPYVTAATCLGRRKPPQLNPRPPRRPFAGAPHSSYYRSIKYFKGGMANPFPFLPIVPLCLGRASMLYGEFLGRP